MKINGVAVSQFKLVHIKYIIVIVIQKTKCLQECLSKIAVLKECLQVTLTRFADKSFCNFNWVESINKMLTVTRFVDKSFRDLNRVESINTTAYVEK